MFYQQTIKPKAVNDNRHDQFHWNFMYTFVNYWLDRQKIPLDQWNFNRSIHYTYELYNRPWLPESARTRDIYSWLKNEAVSKGFPPRNLTSADMPG